MTLIIPKPKPLYAPMLATFGGGSVRGFGRNLPSGGLDFPLTGRVYQMSTQETLRYNASAGINGNNEEAKNTNMATQSNFESTIMDVAFSSDDTSVHRIVGVAVNGSSVNTIPLDFTSSTSVTNTSHNQFNGTRGLMMLRNGVMVTGNNAHNSLATWKMNTDGTFSNYGNTANGTHFDNIQCIINPNDGAGVGDDTHIFVAGSAGGRFTTVRIGGDGSITILRSHTDTTSSGYQVWMSPMKSTDADKLRFMAFFAGNNTKVFDYSISNNTLTTVAAGTSLAVATYGRVISATPGWGGYTYVGFEGTTNGNHKRIAKISQNGQLSNSLTNTTYVGRYMTAILAIEDGTSGSNANGHIYFGCYNAGSSPERRLMATDDRNVSGFSGEERTNERLANGSGYTNGNTIIGERPRYLEMDAKLESTNW